jgi:hypothetical protein
MKKNIINFQEYKKVKGLENPFMPSVLFKKKGEVIDFVKTRNLELRNQAQQDVKWKANFLRMCMYPRKFKLL